ncbi:hypothetical protein N7490_004713 [Penicillium lividum]|nr:hypothetical protein N7490_004713 [Penicillium lividum]
MKFTGFSVSLALAGLVSSAALPVVPGGSAVGGVVNTVTGALSGLKRDGGDALSGAAYGVSGTLNGVTGIAGSAAGTAESTSAGAVGTVEHTVTGVAPTKRQVGGLMNTVKGATSDVIGGVTAGLKRDGGDAVSGAVYGATSSLNGVTGIAGSAAGTVESTSSGAVGTVEHTVSGAVPTKRDGGDAVSGAVYGATSSLNGVTGIAGSLAGTGESTTSGAVGTVEHEVAGITPSKRQLPGAGQVVDASIKNDLGMLSGNPSGLIGALGGLQAALSTGGILPSQISTLPAEMQLVVAYLYTA